MSAGRGVNCIGVVPCPSLACHFLCPVLSGVRPPDFVSQVEWKGGRKWENGVGEEED